jgi:HD-like signal output (HDOD) protein
VRRTEETLVKDLLEELQSGYSLPSLSPVAMKIVEMASDETCSAESMSRLIENDPSLAVRLLRLANSAFFAARYPVSTLRQAVVRIGVERLRIMALSLSLRDTFPMGRVGCMDYEAFWRCSIYRALLGKSLAQSVRTCNPEEAFIAGLTLEIGLLVFVDRSSRIRMKRPTSTKTHLSLFCLGNANDTVRTTGQSEKLRFATGDSLIQS